MDVKYLGFSVSVENNNISIDELLNSFVSSGCVIDDEQLNERRFYVQTSPDDNYYRGLVVTVKDQKRFCRFTNEDGSFRIEVDNLQGDDKLLDFNFFIINKDTGLGLYQHYHQSCSLNVFGQYLAKYYRRLRDSKIESERSILEASQNRSLDKKQEKFIKRKFKSKLIFAPLVRQETLKDILAAYKEIKAFEFEYTYLDDDVRKATPLSRYVKRKREKLTFSKAFSVRELGREIASFVDDNEPKSGRVFVEDYDGESYPLRIFNMPDCFGTEDYDDLAIKLHGLDVTEFHKHKFVDEIIDIYESEEFEHIFGMELEQ